MTQENENQEWADVAEEVANDARESHKGFMEKVVDDASLRGDYLSAVALIQIAEQLSALVQLTSIDLITDLEQEDDEDEEGEEE